MKGNQANLFVCTCQRACVRHTALPLPLPLLHTSPLPFTLPLPTGGLQWITMGPCLPRSNPLQIALQFAKLSEGVMPVGRSRREAIVALDSRQGHLQTNSFRLSTGDLPRVRGGCWGCRRPEV